MRFENILRIIGEEFDPLKECLHSAFYYGSIARGDYKYGSDVDVLFILDYDFECTIEPREFYKKLARWYTSVR